MAHPAIPTRPQTPWGTLAHTGSTPRGSLRFRFPWGLQASWSLLQVPSLLHQRKAQHSGYLLVLVLYRLFYTKRALLGDQALKLQQPQCHMRLLRNSELHLQCQLVPYHRKAAPGPGCASGGCFCTKNRVKCLL